jgi:hypothetical protein
MGRAIPDEGGDGADFAPTAELRETGAMLKGVLLGKRETDMGFGPKPIYGFKVLDASCKFLLKKAEVQPAEGDAVDVIAPTRLARQLAHVNVGDTVTIEYAGRKKVGKGQPAHIFKVEVE